MTIIITELHRRHGELMLQVYTKPFNQIDVLDALLEDVFGDTKNAYAVEKNRYIVCDVVHTQAIHDWVRDTRYGQNLVDDFVLGYLADNPPLHLAADASAVTECNWGPLRQHQIDVCRAILRLPRPRALLALDQGLGKTLCALTICQRWSPTQKVLVVCPATLRNNWVAEIERWLGVDQPVFVAQDTKSTTVKDLVDNRFTVCSYAFLRLFNKPLPRYGTVIFDEAHSIKTFSSKQTKAARKVLKDTRRVLFLTGTPIPNNHAEAYTMLRALVDHREFYTFTRFKQRYCGYKFNPMFGGYEAKGADCPEELSLLLESRMARIIKADIALNLPEKKRFEIVLPNDNDTIKRLTDEIKKHRAGPDVIRECFQAIADTKVDRAVMYLYKYLIAHPDTEKIVVFYHHKSVGDKLEQGLTDVRGPVFRIEGSTPSKKRQGIINTFLETDDGIALLTIGTCATGLNMPTVKTVFFAELNFVPANLMQCEDRFHRLTSTGQHVKYHYLVLEASCDQHILSVLRRKDKVVRKLYKVEDRDSKRVKITTDELTL